MHLWSYSFVDSSDRDEASNGDEVEICADCVASSVSMLHPHSGAASCNVSQLNIPDGLENIPSSRGSLTRGKAHSYYRKLRYYVIFRVVRRVHAWTQATTDRVDHSSHAKNLENSTI